MENGHNVGHRIHTDVLAGRARRRRVYIERKHLRGAHSRSSDGQNTGAGTEVQHVGARYGQCLKQLEAELGARMEACAEGQPRIERYHEIVGPGRIVEPRGGDHPTPAHLQRVIVLTPSNLPVPPPPSTEYPTYRGAPSRRHARFRWPG